MILCLLQDELSALKEKLEQKEAEVKRLQEKLVCKLKGEGIEILDRGKNMEGSLRTVQRQHVLLSRFIGGSASGCELQITDKILNFHTLSSLLLLPHLVSIHSAAAEPTIGIGS